MAKKIMMVSLVLGLALAGMAFASGQKEPGVPDNVTGQKMVVTGTVSVTNLVHPTIKSGDKLYLLMVPRPLVYRSGVKDGAKVTVEGYQVQDLPRWATVDGAINLFVTKATIDGKDYDLSQYGGGRFAGPGYDNGPGNCPGPRYGMMGWGGRGGRGHMGWDWDD
jgi:hypothetical protein